MADADELAREREAEEFLAAMTPKIMSNANMPSGIPATQRAQVDVQTNKHAAALLSANLMKIQKEEAVRNKISPNRASVKSPERKFSEDNNYQNRVSFKASATSKSSSNVTQNYKPPAPSTSNGVKTVTPSTTTSIKRQPSPVSSVISKPPAPTTTNGVKTVAPSTTSATSMKRQPSPVSSVISKPPIPTNTNGVKTTTPSNSSMKRQPSPVSTVITKPPPPPTVTSNKSNLKSNGTPNVQTTIPNKKSNDQAASNNQTVSTSVTVVRKTTPAVTKQVQLNSPTSTSSPPGGLDTTRPAKSTGSAVPLYKTPTPPPPQSTTKITPQPKMATTSTQQPPKAMSGTIVSPPPPPPTVPAVKSTPPHPIEVTPSTTKPNPETKSPPPSTGSIESTKTSKPPAYTPRRFQSSTGVYTSTMKAIESQIDDDLAEDLVKCRAAGYFTNKQKAVGAGKLGNNFKSNLSGLIDGTQTLCKTEEELLSTLSKGKPQLGRVVDDPTPAPSKPAVGRIIDTPSPQNKSPEIKQKLDKVIGGGNSSSSFKPQLGRVVNDSPATQPNVSESNGNTAVSSNVPPPPPPSNIAPPPPPPVPSSSSAPPPPPVPSSSSAPPPPPLSSSVPPPPPPSSGGAPPPPPSSGGAPPPPPSSGGAPPPPSSGGAPPPPPPSSGGAPPPPPPPPPPVGYIPPKKSTPIEVSTSSSQNSEPRKPPAMLGQSGIDLQSELMKKLSSRK